jgi:hypothetical protein
MSRKRRSAFVPRVIFGTVFVGVVPACALMNCGGDDSGASGQGGNAGVMPFGVAAVAFAGFSNAGGARGGGFSVAAGGFGVAAVAFGGFAGVNAGGTNQQDAGGDTSTEGSTDGADVGAKDARSDSSG